MAEPQSGPVAITGASGQVGTLLRERLGERPNEVRTLDQGEDWGPGIEGAQVVAHLAGTLQPKGENTYESANVKTTATVAAAAAGAGVERIVFLSYVGAEPGSSNQYLRAKARAEQILASSGVPTTVFRCLHIFGPPQRPGPTAGAFLAADHKPIAVPGSGKQRIAPLYIGDVVDGVLKAALDPEAPPGTFDLGGPDEMSMDDFVRRLNGGEARIRHLPAPLARIAARLSPSLTPALIDLLLRDNVVADPSGVAARFEISLHGVDDVWGGAQRG